MTVGELIEELAKLPADLPVVVARHNDGFGGWFTFDDVDEREMHYRPGLGYYTPFPGGADDDTPARVLRLGHD